MVDLTQLATELNTDPLGLGYAAHIATGDDISLETLINATTGPGVGSVTRVYVDSGTLQSAVVPSEFIPLDTAQRELWLAILVSSQGQVKVEDTMLRSQIAQVWGAGTTTRANMLALQTKQGSRAEVLFGDGAVVTLNDIAKALRG